MLADVARVVLPALVQGGAPLVAEAFADSVELVT
jgi:hypothetical protein